MRTRNFFVLAICIFTAIGAGCSGGETGSPTPTPSPPPAPAPTPIPPPGAGFPVPFDTGLSYSRELYVDAAAPNGGNGSQGSPYNTINAALRQASAGTRIRVAAGTYGAIGSFSNLHGTSTAPIALVGEGAVIVDTGGTDLALHLTDPRYVVIQGITVQNAFPHGINIDDGGSYSSPADYVVLRNMTFRNIGNGGNSDCLKMSGVNNFYVEGSSFSECNNGEAIDMVGCHNGVIGSNVFFNLPVNGVQTKGGSADVLIHGNRFVDIGQRSINAGGSTGSTYYRPSNTTHEALRIQMVANIFQRPAVTPVAFVGCDTCVFANNTIIEPGTFLARILEENTALQAGSNGHYINNIIMLNTNNRGSVVNIGGGTQPSSFTFWFQSLVFSGQHRLHGADIGRQYSGGNRFHHSAEPVARQHLPSAVWKSSDWRWPQRATWVGRRFQSQSVYVAADNGRFRGALSVALKGDLQLDSRFPYAFAMTDAAIFPSP